MYYIHICIVVTMMNESVNYHNIIEYKMFTAFITDQEKDESNIRTKIMKKCHNLMLEFFFFNNRMVLFIFYRPTEFV
jgi:hypothetical protein